MRDENDDGNVKTAHKFEDDSDGEDGDASDDYNKRSWRAVFTDRQRQRST